MRVAEMVVAFVKVKVILHAVTHTGYACETCASLSIHIWIKPTWHHFKMVVSIFMSDYLSKVNLTLLK